MLQEQNAHRQGRGGTLTAEASTVEETPLVSSRAWLQLLLPKRAALYSLRLTLQSSKQRNHDPGAIAGREGGKVRARVLAVCTRPSSKRKKDSGGYLNRVRGSDTGRPEFTGTRSPPLPVAGPQLLTEAWQGRSPPLTSIFFLKQIIKHFCVSCFNGFLFLLTCQEKVETFINRTADTCGKQSRFAVPAM